MYCIINYIPTYNYIQFYFIIVHKSNNKNDGIRRNGKKGKYDVIYI